MSSQLTSSTTLHQNNTILRRDLKLPTISDSLTTKLFGGAPWTVFSNFLAMAVVSNPEQLCLVRKLSSASTLKILQQKWKIVIGKFKGGTKKLSDRRRLMKVTHIFTYLKTVHGLGIKFFYQHQSLMRPFHS